MLTLDSLRQENFRRVERLPSDMHPTQTMTRRDIVHRYTDDVLPRLTQGTPAWVYSGIECKGSLFLNTLTCVHGKNSPSAVSSEPAAAERRYPIDATLLAWSYSRCASPTLALRASRTAMKGRDRLSRNCLRASVHAPKPCYFKRFLTRKANRAQGAPTFE
jgi:hypothetical protein